MGWLHVPVVGPADALFEGDRGRPSQGLQPADVEQLAGGAVGLVRVPHDLAPVTDDALDDLGEFADGQILARADVDQAVGNVGRSRMLHEIDGGVGHVVDVEELPAGRSRAPELHGGVGRPGHSVFPRRTHLGFVELAQHRGQHVAGVQVEVVARPVQVGGHERQVVGAVFAIETAAHLDAGDLRQCVRAVGLFQRAGEEVLLLERLRGELGVDARAAQEQQSPHAVPEGGVDDVELDGQVVVDELVGLFAVGEDAADTGRGQDDQFGLLSGEERAGGRLVGEVELRMGAQDQVVVSAGAAERAGWRRPRDRDDRRGRCGCGDRPAWQA